MSIDPKRVEVALEHCETTPFEKFSQAVFGAVLGPRFVALGGYKDGGADGFVEADLYEREGRPTEFFQASKEATVKSKIKGTIARLREYGRDVKVLWYASSRTVKDIDILEFELKEELDVQVSIRDRAFFAHRVNHNADTVAAYESYLAPAIQFLIDQISPSFPQKVPFENAHAVCAFLGQELERRIGTASTLEAVCDALILWALEGTDPNAGKFMSQGEISSKVEAVIPSARRFFRGQIGERLKALTKKTEGARQVNVYATEGKYCLPYDTRKVLEASAVEDEALKSQVSSKFLDRLAQKADGKLNSKQLAQVVEMLHQTLETVFERQGIDAARHFLDEEANSQSVVLDNRTIVAIAETILNGSKLATLNVDVLQLMKSVLREVFYSSEEAERSYCARLARTYVLLFTIRNTPEIIEYFNTMSRTFTLYVGTDLIVRALSEYFLDSNDQMTINTFKILAQAGSKLVLSEVTLEEVHSHIWAAHREFENVYQEIDHIVDRDLAAQSDRILIRAYYYAKLDKGNRKAPASWGPYLSNFLSVNKMSGPTSEASMKSLRDTLCNLFQFEYEAREDMEKSIDEGELDKLTDKILEIRNWDQKANEEVRARNDALHLLHVSSLRRGEAKQPSSPYGYKSWWLTQETASGKAYAQLYPQKRANKYIMRPEFLVNYIAYNPTSEEVRTSIRSIFPSLLGIRLGDRIERTAFAKIMGKIKEAFAQDPARAQALVTEHSDALKTDNMRNFLLKYNSAV